MAPEYQRVNVEILITEVYSKFLRQYKNTSETITHIYHAVNEYKETAIKPLPTDSMPISIIDPQGLKPEFNKERTFEWLFKKGFEEFIVGLTESLIEAYKCAQLYSLAKDSWANAGKYTEEKIQEEIENTRRQSMDLFFSTLLEKIEKLFDVSIPLKSEIISINKVRNCLVHRNGLVTDKDINDTSSNCLKLIYTAWTSYMEINGEMIESKWEYRRDGTYITRLEQRPEQKTIYFKNGEGVAIDHNIYNGVAYTCTTFSKHLLDIVCAKCNSPIQKQEVHFLHESLSQPSQKGG